ncbi:MAG: hypothetical protein FJ194_19725 [Gammaproteobacteria bacterium]|nr:hypothetical protein [Gammaproteobacteria bacterium]
MGLTARHLEENGIPTVIIGSAIDIIEYCGVPRYFFTDLPLGNPLGHPGDAEEQQRIVEQGVALFGTAHAPGQTVHAGVRWSADDCWRARYAEVRPEDFARLKAAGDARRAQRALLKTEGKLRD